MLGAANHGYKGKLAPLYVEVSYVETDYVD